MTGRWACPLCGRRDNKTVEHIVTDWMHRYWGGGTFSLPGDPKGRDRVKIFICGQCNAYFNVQLEQPSHELLKQMMAGRPVQLSPVQQDLLTRYFAKFFLLMSMWPHYPEGNDPYVTPQDLRKFADDLTLPRGTRVWLGAIDDADPTREQAITRALPEAFEAPRNREARWLLPLGSSCHLLQLQHVFAVLFWLRPSPIPRLEPENDARVLIARTREAGLLSRIYPTDIKPVPWPPRESFERTTYHRWADRFGYVPPDIAPTIRLRP